ncbi:uncharacterized protein LOC129756057 [Uranotaenia lowii]|uniref:uncharacterized protein LOC129756057 n=1 Tax=Uranotaenia lowii TaxID=190385 RepID=UPI00247A9AD4|nr:uncharacterized protein LOC129756057 [Uranotaenia lowii]
MNESRFLLNQSELNSSSYAEEIRCELQRLRKNQLLMKLLKLPNCPLSVNNRALLGVHLSDNPLPLGLDYIRNVEMSYHDRVALNRFVESKVLEHTRPIIDRLLKLTDNNLDSLGSVSYKHQQEILTLDAEKRSLTEKLIKLKNRKLHFMNLCAEMRTGPYQKNSVETKNAESKALQIKAETTQKVMIHEVITRNAHAMKAVKEVEANIDTLLALK